MRRGWGFGFDPSEWAFGWPGGRKQRRGQWFESGDMKYVILKLLAKRPMHGYEVMKALEEETHGCYKPSPGTVYPTLQWLEDEGLVKADTADGKKVYAITDSGRAFLEKWQETDPLGHLARNSPMRQVYCCHGVIGELANRRLRRAGSITGVCVAR